MNNLLILAAVAMSHIGVMAVHHVTKKRTVEEAHKSGFLKGYRKCATARRTIIKPTTNKHQH
jgi:hypothetical protein